MECSNESWQGKGHFWEPPLARVGTLVHHESASSRLRCLSFFSLSFRHPPYHGPFYHTFSPSSSSVHSAPLHARDASESQASPPLRSHRQKDQSPGPGPPQRVGRPGAASASCCASPLPRYDAQSGVKEALDKRKEIAMLPKTPERGLWIKSHWRLGWDEVKAPPSPEPLGIAEACSGEAQRYPVEIHLASAVLERPPPASRSSLPDYQFDVGSLEALHEVFILVCPTDRLWPVLVEFVCSVHLALHEVGIFNLLPLFFTASIAACRRLFQLQPEVGLIVSASSEF
eukprot:765988-Hanusia_phi.AAC.18